jgi:hypothetical protein
MNEDVVQAIADTNPVVCELELRKSQKGDSIGVIQHLWIKPTGESRLSIPLWRLRALPLVRPTSEVEVLRLECEFVMGYREGDRILYVSAFNNVSVDLPIPPGIMASWSPLWQEASVEFDAKLKKDPDLAHFAGKMFFVWEGNHRFTAWWRHINNHHADDKSWYITVDCIVINPRGCTGVFLNATSNIIW